MKTTLGINGALILAILTSKVEATVAEVAERLESIRDIDDGSIYVALQRMSERGLVQQRKVRTRSADGRKRDIGVYTITAEGVAALDAFQRESAALPKLRFGSNPA